MPPVDEPDPMPPVEEPGVVVLPEPVPVLVPPPEPMLPELPVLPAVPPELEGEPMELPESWRQRVFSAPVSASQRDEPTLEPDDGVVLEPPALLGELVVPDVEGDAPTLGEALPPEVLPLVCANAADIAKSAEAVAAANSFNVI